MRQARADDRCLPDDLVAISASGLLAAWENLEQRPEWVTVVVSLRKPTMLPDFAQRLAERLKLPFYAVIQKVQERPEQRTMQNSYQQTSNVLDTFCILGDVPTTPVLLVDDIVDSGWTLTVVGIRLREAGCPTVYPFALAKGMSREG